MRTTKKEKEQSQETSKPKKRPNFSKMTLMQHIEKIVSFTKESKFSDEAIANCKPHAKILSDKLSLTERQTVFLAIFIDQSYDESIKINDIARHFDCRNVALMCHSEDFDAIEKRGYIRKRKPSRHQRHSTYRVPEDVVGALKKNTPYSAPSITNLTPKKFFDFLYQLFNDAEDDELSIEDLSQRINELIEENPHLEISKAINSYSIDNEEDGYEVTMLLLFCHKFVNENDDSLGFYDMERIFNSKSEFINVRNGFKYQWNTLFTQNLVETKKGSDLVSRDYYSLTDKAKDELLSELEIEIKKQKKPEDIICATDIAVKSLYYNKKENSQIAQLSSLLQQENFMSVQKRLIGSGMRKGFACLFYGVPGTGKTETVYQIARQTNRDILTVNVSEIKSMWVGESEKHIKGLFDRYRRFSEQSETTPILLFNEADAVLGIRQNGAERAVDKMENSIQNIILQEMENLDGIMIATTNLTQNLDKAFERRFLYKIEFEKPCIEAKEKIWQTMLPTLSEQERLELANNYNFSGGQIENIVRKYTVDSILSGVTPTLETVHSYCQSEFLYKNEERKRIGFN
ncbi:ATP-binding protein [Parabacteroides sp. PM5-20]|uniref:ATP-binding protein n=1 Tax=Parabacteroides sp. PM5-20 TaxID=2940527 RepID=UPI00247367DA|nr:ATP-binding protein [Parabacteroides sp. PM5-20]